MIEYAANKHEVSLYSTLVGVKMEDVEKLIHIPYRKCVIHIPDKNCYANINVSSEYIEVLQKFLNAKKAGGERLVNHLSCQGKPDSRIKNLIQGFYILDDMEDRGGLLNNEEEIEKSEYNRGSIVCRHCGVTRLNHNVLFPDGTVGLCAEDWSLRHPLGNLLQQSYEEIRESPMLQYIRKSLLIEEENDILCRHCIHAKKLDDIEIESWQTEKYIKIGNSI